jgi:hypothetical protein
MAAGLLAVEEKRTVMDIFVHSQSNGEQELSTRSVESKTPELLVATDTPHTTHTGIIIILREVQ